MIRTKQSGCECGTQSQPLICPPGFTSVETPASETHLKQLKHSFDHTNGKERHNFYCSVSLRFFFSLQQEGRQKQAKVGRQSEQVLMTKLSAMFQKMMTYLLQQLPFALKVEAATTNNFSDLSFKQMEVLDTLFLWAMVKYRQLKVLKVRKKLSSRSKKTKIN